MIPIMIAMSMTLMIMRKTIMNTQKYKYCTSFYEYCTAFITSPIPPLYLIASVEIVIKHYHAVIHLDSPVFSVEGDTPSS